MDTSLPPRIYQDQIAKDLIRKMVFMGGPRQVGKTTLAQSYLKNYFDGHPAYLNWDNDQDRMTIQKQSWDKAEKLIVLDEIHKRKNWQSFLKGVYDKWKNTQKFLVTGSARLDVYRKGGDSMLGRYHYIRIHPYTLPEFGNSFEKLNTLFEFGGFPEPLLFRDSTELRRWHRQRLSKIVRVDLRDLENISDLDKVELLAEVLPERVGSLLSYSSLAQDLESSDKTVKRWVQILSNLYFCFLVQPFGTNPLKMAKKMPKAYLWDWSQVLDKGPRFENFVASHLLKKAHFLTDIEGYKSDLQFIQDPQSGECDFVFVKEKKPLFAVECKFSETRPSKRIFSLRAKFPSIPAWYQVHFEQSSPRKVDENLWILNFGDFCKHVDLV
jgi:predicted AAA+ superfamily ATPase